MQVERDFTVPQEPSYITGLERALLHRNHVDFELLRCFNDFGERHERSRKHRRQINHVSSASGTVLEMSSNPLLSSLSSSLLHNSDFTSYNWTRFDIALLLYHSVLRWYLVTRDAAGKDRTPSSSRGRKDIDHDH